MRRAREHTAPIFPPKKEAKPKVVFLSLLLSLLLFCVERGREEEGGMGRSTSPRGYKKHQTSRCRRPRCDDGKASLMGPKQRVQTKTKNPTQATTTTHTHPHHRPGLQTPRLQRHI